MKKTYGFFGLSASAATGTSFLEHADTMQVVIGVLFGILIAFIAYVMRKIDKNQTEMFNRLNTLSQDFYTLKGQHEGIVGNGRHPK